MEINHKNLSTPLEAHQISRSYGSYQAMAETDLELHGGEITLLSGPNGSGKTTLLLLLSGLLRPTTGSVKIEGFDLYRDERQAKQRLALVPDVPRFYTELTAWEHLRFQALAFSLSESDFEKRAEGYLKEFNLWEARDLFPHNYSRGMRLKLGLIMALIRPLRVLLLDEPTSALDMEGVEQLKLHLERLRGMGAAVLLTSHDPLLGRGLSDRILKLEHGHLEEAM
ncbi:MAG: ATP-binding cassette domain-containing protein [Omnitrophica WOR_2 bacterium]